MFWCLPPSGKCEWANLKAFAEQFNGTFGTQYRLSKCLDILDSSKPQPEIQLESTGEQCMVIERKAIVWPPDYLQSHNSEHKFFGYFVPRVSPAFQDDAYQLELRTRDVHGNKEYVKHLAREIADAVLTRRAQVIEAGAIYSSHPIEWCFRQIQEYERDDDTPKNGVGVSLKDPLRRLPRSHDELPRVHKRIAQTVDKLLAKAAIKFVGYPNCLRVVVLEAYGDNLLPTDEDIEQIIQSALWPSNIDQIWLAEPEWLTESEFEVTYRQVRAC
jgi:hypothetical protein